MAPEAAKILGMIPTAKAHPMSTLRTCVSIEGNLDPRADDTSVEYETEIAIRLTAQMATITGAIARIRLGRNPIMPDPSLSHAGNLLYMMTGEKPDPVVERVMDISLILHADHGMNASTFTTMVVNSSLSDMYGSVVAGIASLKGPLHGGANERVLYDLEEIGGADNVEAWFKKAQETKRKVMGFGQRVYKAYDPRARIFGPIAGALADRNAEVKRLYDVALKLDGIVCSQLGEKKIFPNVDFYSGLIYKAMGIETAMFTPIFAVSRVAGWTARALEYLHDNRIFRPRAIYVGPISVPYTPVDKR
jgi:citrate synthase